MDAVDHEKYEQYLRAKSLLVEMGYVLVEQSYFKGLRAEVERLTAQLARVRNYFAVRDDETWGVITLWENGMPEPGPEVRTLRAEFERLTAELAAMRERERWIPVGERLPDTDAVYPWSTVEVEIWCDGENVSSAFYHLDRGQWMRNNGTTVEGVTHWRELPAPPEAL